MLLKDKFCIESMVESKDKIINYSSKYNSPENFYNTVEYEASIMNFIVLGEMSEKLSNDILSTYPTIGWRGIKDFRNIAAHNYFGLDVDEIWSIVQNYLPELRIQLAEIINNISTSDLI